MRPDVPHDGLGHRLMWFVGVSGGRAVNGGGPGVVGVFGFLLDGEGLAALHIYIGSEQSHKMGRSEQLFLYYSRHDRRVVVQLPRLRVAHLSLHCLLVER